jgi:hypothetical protein
METIAEWERRDRERHSGGHRGARDWDDAKIEDYCNRIAAMIAEARTFAEHDAETDEARAFWSDMAGGLTDDVLGSLPVSGCVEYVRERIAKRISAAHDCLPEGV